MVFKQTQLYCHFCRKEIEAADVGSYKIGDGDHCAVRIHLCEDCYEKAVILNEIENLRGS